MGLTHGPGGGALDAATQVLVVLGLGAGRGEDGQADATVEGEAHGGSCYQPGAWVASAFAAWLALAHPLW